MGQRAGRQLLLADATALLSGPKGLAAWLRTTLLDRPGRLDQPAPRPRQAHRDRPRSLRKAIALRDQHCGFPGCAVPPAVLPRPPHHPARRRRPHQPGELHPRLRLPSPHRHPPLGLETHPQPRRHHHSSPPPRLAHTPQPRTTALPRDASSAVPLGQLAIRMPSLCCAATSVLEHPQSLRRTAAGGWRGSWHHSRRSTLMARYSIATCRQLPA